MSIKRYKKKPIPVEAIQLTPENLAEVSLFVGNKGRFYVNHFGAYGDIFTLEGIMKCTHGSYIIKGNEGEFWAVKQSIFEKTYEEVND